LIDYSGGALCGAGHRHSGSYTAPRSTITDAEVTCARCLSFQEQLPPEPRFAVQVTSADNPAANTAEHLTATEIAARWRHLGDLVTDPSFLGIRATFEDLTEVRIAKSNMRPGDLGYDAGYDGVGIEENPYTAGTAESDEWERGHVLGHYAARQLKEIGLY
jgi:hypothetical protein